MSGRSLNIDELLENCAIRWKELGREWEVRLIERWPVQWRLELRAEKLLLVDVSLASISHAIGSCGFYSM